VALWIWAHVEPLVDGLSEIVLWETPSTCAVVRAGDVR
jgi:hypothetical protein